MGRPEERCDTSPLGNGRLLATVDCRGRLSSLYWPHPDFPQHLGWLEIALQLEGKASPLAAGAGWVIRQVYLPDTVALETIYRRPGQAVRQLDLVLPAQDVLVRQLVAEGTSGSGTGFSCRVGMRPGGWPAGDALYYHRGYGALVFYHRDYAFALGADRPPSRYQVGRAAASGREVKPARLEAAVQHTGGVLEWTGGRITLFLAAAAAPEAALRLLAETRRQETERLVAATAAHWQDWLARRTPLAEAGSGRDALYRRSLLVLALLQDPGGAIIAAPEVDPHFRHSGGYGYCWPRDGVYCSLAWQAAGYPERAEAFYCYLLQVQEESGLWQQRYYASGHPAPVWDMQLDETGSVLWGMLAGGSTPAWVSTCRPGLEKGSRALLALLDPGTGLPAASDDLWEERWAVHAYTAAAVCAGLAAAARAAELAGGSWQGPPAAGLQRAAAVLQRQISVRFLAGGHFARTLQADGRPDQRLDASLCGLVYPFALLSPVDPAWLATMEALAHRLPAAGDTGLRRYPGDRYRGGNPWLLTTLWLAICRALAGQREEAERLLAWVEERATPAGLLAEQVRPLDGSPAWVLPLAWSHAMYILALEILGGRETRAVEALPPPGHPLRNAPSR